MNFEDYCSSIVKTLQVDQEITKSKLTQAEADCKIQAKTIIDKYKQEYSECEAKKEEIEKNQLYLSNINKENELLQIEIDNYQKEFDQLKNNNDKILSELYQIEQRNIKAKASLSEKDRLYVEKIRNLLRAYKTLTRVYWDLEASTNNRLCGYVFNAIMKKGKYFTIENINEREDEEVVNMIWSKIKDLNGKNY